MERLENKSVEELNQIRDDYVKILTLVISINLLTTS